jgi:hypothetical protein
VRGDIKVRLSFEADVAGLARKFPAEFEQAEQTEGYQEWEKGSVFLWDLVSEYLEVFLAEIPGLLLDRSTWNEPEIEFRWTTEMAAALNESLGVGT